MSSSSSSSSCSEVVRIERIIKGGKGRGVISSQPLKSGQIILTDSPILTYSSLPLFLITNNNNIKKNTYCSKCYVTIINNNSNNSNSNSVTCCCDTCLAPFCGLSCRTEAAATCHTTWACTALRSLRGYAEWYRYPEDFQVQARFLVAAYNLAVVSPSGFRTLLSLQGEGNVKEGEENGAAFILHSLVSLLCQVPNGLGMEFCLETTAALLAKDKLNAFGLMEPFSPSSEQSGEQRQRSVRAYGIYPNASLFNHDCLPNACRFDYIDQKSSASSLSKNNTDIVIRMIHDVPEGREICLSYFPVNLNYRERQLRLKDDYGFVCTCDRCRVEANWSDDDEDDVAMDEDGGEDESMEAGEELDDEEDGSNMVKEGGERESDDFPHAYFFLRYMCTQQDCWGTLAPLPTPPSSNGTTMTMVMECNVCGNLKNDEQDATDCQS